MQHGIHPRTGRPTPPRSPRPGVAAFSLLLAIAAAVLLASAGEVRADKVTPATLTLEDVQGAVGRATEALLEIEPRFTLDDYDRRSRRSRENIGDQAIATWAMIDSGMTYQTPRLYRRVSWVLSGSTPDVFDRAMRLLMLSEMPFQRWKPWIHRDYVYLQRAMTTKGSFTRQYKGKRRGGFGDNAHAQYGALGLFGVDRAGLEANQIDNMWLMIDKYWRDAQRPDGGWSIVSAQTESRAKTDEISIGSMTAGGVSTLTYTERKLRGARIQGAGASLSTELQRGIAWLDSKFDPDDPASQRDYFLYMWTMQRVAEATGKRTFNGVDWFRDITTDLINSQRPEGYWQGRKGRLLSTGFATLYLSSAFKPLGISKIQLTDAGAVENWNNWPHDIWNFADYISDEYEFETSWQTATLDMPVYSLIETPMLWLSSNADFALTDDQVANLRGYLDAGGMLVLNQDERSAEAGRAFDSLINRLYPGEIAQTVPRDHDFYRIHKRTLAAPPMRMVHNGIRPVIVWPTPDFGRALQSNQTGGGATGAVFETLSNVYLYATGLNPEQSRLAHGYVVQPDRKAKMDMNVARIRHGGNYNPEPAAMPQLKAFMARHHDVDLILEDVRPEDLSRKYKIAFLTTTGDAELTMEQARGIREWILDGGTLWIDAAGGGDEAREDADRLQVQIFPSGKRQQLASSHPVISGQNLVGSYNNARVRWRNYALITLGRTYRPRLEYIDVNNRAAVFFSGEDLTCGLAGIDTWGILGYTPEYARKIVANGLLFTLSQYANTFAGTR